MSSAQLRLGRTFRMFWAGQSVSFVGSQITDFILPVLAVITLGAGPVWLSLIVAAGHLPNLLAPLYAGPLTDRLSRYRLIIGTDVARFGLIVAIPVLALAGALTLPVLVGIVLIHSAVSVTYDVACFSYLPDVVDKDRLTAANGAIQSSVAIAQVAGPSAAGLLLAVLAAPAALVADAGSYLISTALLLGSKAPEITRRARTSVIDTQRGFLRDAAVGVRSIWHTPALRTLNLSSGGYNFWEGASLSVFAIYALHVLDLSATTLGVAAGLGALGGVFGASVASRLESRYRAASLVPALLMLSCGENVVLVAAHFVPNGGRAVLVSLAMLIGTALTTAYVVLVSTIRQLAVPDEVRGRVAASTRFFTRGPMPIGALLGGAVAAATAPIFVLALCALGRLALGLWCWRRRRDLAPTD